MGEREELLAILRDHFDGEAPCHFEECADAIMGSRGHAQCTLLSPTIWGQISDVYGNLNAEDCKYVDREWAKMRGYILPTDGTSTVSLRTPQAADAEMVPLAHDELLKVISARSPEAADAGAVARSFAHYLANLEFQPTGKDPKAGGYAYAKVPEWQLRQWAASPAADAVRNALDEWYRCRQDLSGMTLLGKEKDETEEQRKVREAKWIRLGHAEQALMRAVALTTPVVGMREDE